MKIKKKKKTPATPSKQVEEVGKWWVKSVAASSLHKSMDELREFNENWAGLTAEPGGVDYLETDAGGVPAMWAVPKGCIEDRVILCLHGGGYFSGSMYTHRKMYGHFAKNIGCRALILNYRLSPENIYPAAINDVVNAYQWLLGQGIKANHIAIVGDSAGGGLSLTSTLLIRDKNLPIPAAVMPFSAWFDTEFVGQSMEINFKKDLLLNREWIRSMLVMYLGENGNIKDPYVNPLYADLANLPPIYLQVGGDEVLLDDSIRLSERAENAGVDVRLDIFPGMQHSFQMAAGRAPESDEAISRYVKWVKPKLGLV